MSRREEARRRRLAERNSKVLHALCRLAEKTEELIAFNAIEAEVERQHPGRYSMHEVLGALLSLEENALVQGTPQKEGRAMPLLRPTEDGMSSYKAAH